MARVYFDNSTHGVRRLKHSRNEKIEAIAKVVSLFGFMVVLGGFMLIRGSSATRASEPKVSSSFGRVEYVAPYKNTLYENFGFVQEPKITFPLKTTQGYVDTVFLLDSGAVVSALPLQAAQDIGIDLTQARRITLQGFSGIPTFAYLDEITVMIGKREFSFPAVFTESTKTTYILGRKGLFDDFTIEFDNNTKSITLTTRE